MRNYKNFEPNSNFITGLTEAEGCFSICVYKDKGAKYKLNARLDFTIKMLYNEAELLYNIKFFFNCGNLWYYKDDTSRFQVSYIYSIKNKILPHFIQYPLRGTKYLDFLSFKEAFDMIENKEHFTEKGLDKLYLLSKSINKGRSFKKETYYSPDHTKLDNKNYVAINGRYVNGFIAEDGSFVLHLGKLFGTMRLFISQHIIYMLRYK